jgi:predicted trehalose synthase
MKTTFKKITLSSAVAVAMLGALSASAMGFPGMNTLSSDEIASRQAQMFQSQASLIGVSLDEVKNAWAEGKNFMTLAKEKGITEEQLQAKMMTERLAKMKEHLQALVTKGVITQAQADKRLSVMQTKSSQKEEGGRGGRGGMHDMMKGFGF